MRQQIFSTNLNELKRKLRESRSDSDESQSAVAQYACVAANGYLESYIRNSVSDKYRHRCDDNAYRIVTKHIDSYYNFKSDKIINFIQRVWPSSIDGVKQFMKGNEQFTGALGSIVYNKNQIAHGGSSNVSSRMVEGWIETLLEHLDDFDEVCLR